MCTRRSSCWPTTSPRCCSRRSAHVPRWRDYYLAPRPDLALRVPARPSSRRCSSCAAAGAGCSSRPSTSSSCRCWTRSSPASSSSSRTATRCRWRCRCSRCSPTPRACTARRCRCRRSPRAGSTGSALMLDALVRDRDTIPPERSIDVRFDDFMADELARRRSRLRARRRAVRRRRARRDQPTTSPGISVAGWARSRPRPRCSASMSATCASRSPRTSSASWQ